MARPTQDRMAVNRGLFADIYKDCCKNEAECKILDIIIAQFLLNEVFKGDEQTERAIAKVTGLSKSGVRVVQGRAMKKMKDSLAKNGIRSADDVINTTSGRTTVGSGGVDEKEKVNEASDIVSICKSFKKYTNKYPPLTQISDEIDDGNGVSHNWNKMPDGTIVCMFDYDGEAEDFWVVDSANNIMYEVGANYTGENFKYTYYEKEPATRSIPDDMPKTK